MKKSFSSITIAFALALSCAFGLFAFQAGYVTSDAIVTTTGTLTNTQVLGMNATPVQVVAAQGAGTLIEVVSGALENLNTGVAYASGGAISFDLNNGGTVTVASATAAATFLTSPIVTQTIAFGPGQASATGANTLNMPLVITNATAAFTTGTGTLKYWLSYRVRSGL